MSDDNEDKLKKVEIVYNDGTYESFDMFYPDRGVGRDDNMNCLIFPMSETEITYIPISSIRKFVLIKE